MSEVVLGTALGAMQIIYAAYRDVKSNRENCAALVHRAELLVIRQIKEEETIAGRIESLLSAFETTAQVIGQIGHKNWLRALLDADRDAIQVEHCHRCLTDLMFLFNIEQNLDQWNLQRENERTRKHDHHNLLQVAHSVQSELTTQGEMIGNVLDMVRTLSQSPTFNVPARAVSRDSATNCTHRTMGSPNIRSMEFDRPESFKPQLQSTTKRHIHMEGTTEGSNTAVPRSQRRISWMDKFGLQKISAVRLSIPSVRPPYIAKSRGTSRSKPSMGTKALPTLAPAKCKSTGSKVPSKGISCDNIGNSSPRRGRKRDSRQPEASQVPLTGTTRTRPSSRSPSASPCGSKYIEVRYYSGDVTSGVLLSKAFESLGKIAIGELRQASSHPTRPIRLSRLNGGNLVMEIPDGIHHTNILKVSSWTNHQGPLPIVWVLGSCGMHLEPIKISTTGESRSEWALVREFHKQINPKQAVMSITACTTDTLVQDVTGVIGKLVNREIVACFRRDGPQTYRMDQGQPLRDCAVGRGMYLEVETML